MSTNIPHDLKELVIAYFAGGNAVGQASPALGLALEAIASFVEKHKKENNVRISGG